MQFNDKVIEILGNFGTINQSIVFKPGNTISTMSPMKTMLAKAKTDLTFTDTFGIYELQRFVALISKLVNPTIRLENKRLIISADNEEETEWATCVASLVVTPPEKGIALPEEDIFEFTLTADTMKRVQGVIPIISSPHTAFSGDKGGFYIEGIDVKNSGSHRYRKKLGDTDKTFRMVFETDNLKLLPRDYTVRISAKGLSHFQAEDVEYYIAVEQTSTYGS